MEQLAGLLPGRDENDAEACTSLAGVLFGVTLTCEQAQSALSELVTHHRCLCERLGCSLDIRVSAMDYATRHPEVVHEPVIVAYETLTLSQRLAAIDELTGLFNRRFLDIYLDKEINRARRYREVFSLLFIDLDNFKRINDTHGHEAGDQILTAFSHEILQLLRREDFAARYGGEEFLVVLPHTNEEGAMRFADRLSERMDATDLPYDARVTFSGGVATYPVHGSATRSLLRNADAALYQAKVGGKAHVRIAASEKRTAPRHVADIPAVCFIEDRERCEVRLHDISRAGLSAQTETRLSPGQMIRFRIMTDDTREQFEVVAQVVWEQQVDESHHRFGGRWATDNPSIVDSLLHHIVAE